MMQIIRNILAAIAIVLFFSITFVGPIALVAWMLSLVFSGPALTAMAVTFGMLYGALYAMTLADF